jgi:hypothetical protein
MIGFGTFSFNLSLRYIQVQDIPSLNNSKFDYYVDRNYHNEFEIKVITGLLLSLTYT